MSWALAGLLSLALGLYLAEALRRAGQLGRAKSWLGVIFVALPLCLALHWRLSAPQDCPASPPPFLDADLSLGGTQDRLEALRDARQDLSDRLARCGGTAERWQVYARLGELIDVLEQDLATQRLQEIQDLR